MPSAKTRTLGKFDFSSRLASHMKRATKTGDVLLHGYLQHTDVTIHFNDFIPFESLFQLWF